LELVTFLLPEACLEGLDELVGQGIYSSRSAAIRFAVLGLLKGELWQQERGTVKEEVVMTRK
jgi:Arc/MetJ-type ribon-helix-helix transcriptional regulator